MTAPKANPGMKWDIASIFRETLLQGAGGVTSAALSQGAKLTENTYDDSPLLQTVVKGTLGLVLRWSFKDRPGVKQFVAGMNGHSIGSAVDQYVINKLAAAVTKGS